MVQIQRVHRRPPGWRPSGYSEAIPLKVLIPSHSPRMVQPNKAAAIWIGEFDAVGFVQVTGRTTPGQVDQFRVATPATRHDMLYMKRGALE